MIGNRIEQAKCMAPSICEWKRTRRQREWSRIKSGS